MSWNAVTPPFTLKEGQLYACSFKLSFLEKAAATPEMVAKKFEDAGFEEVDVDMPNSRAEGHWGKVDQDDVTLPSEVVMVWEWVDDGTAGGDSA